MNKTKLIASLIFIGTLLVSALQAQENKFDIGLEGGPGIRSLYEIGTANGNNEPTIGGAAGISFQYNFSQIFSIKTDIMYERKGDVLNVQYTDANGQNIGMVNVYDNLDYLLIPVLAHASFFKKVRLLIDAGPYVGVVLNSTVVVDAIQQYPKNSVDNMSNTNRLDFGMSIGGGVGIPIKQVVDITFEVRNNVGLLDVNHNSLFGIPFPFSTSGNIKTFSTNFLVGGIYKFGMREKAAK